MTLSQDKLTKIMEKAKARKRSTETLGSRISKSAPTRRVFMITQSPKKPKKAQKRTINENK